MRWCFATAGLVLALASSPGPAAPATSTRVQLTDRVWTVSGYGQTPSDAKDQAREDARAQVQDFLDKKFPDLGWSPTIKDLEDFGVVHVEEPKTTVITGLGPGYEAVAHVDLTDPKLSKMQPKVDEARKKALEPVMWDRHALVGRILAALVALFLVAAGYLRLEELTRGYYTTLLRLGAGAVVLLTVLGLFWNVVF